MSEKQQRESCAWVTRRRSGSSKPGSRPIGGVFRSFGLWAGGLPRLLLCRISLHKEVSALHSELGKKGL